MDKKRERNCVMVKGLVVIAMMVSNMFIYSARSENITNIIQCINTNLTSDVLERFPTNATYSVHSCVLNFIKGSVVGDLKIFAAPFSEQLLFSEFKIYNLENIPASLSHEFSMLMSSISNSTTKVISYSETISNGMIRANIMIHRQGLHLNRSENVHLEIMEINNKWRISDWNVDE